MCIKNLPLQRCNFLASRNKLAVTFPWIKYTYACTRIGCAGYSVHHCFSEQLMHQRISRANAGPEASCYDHPRINHAVLQCPLFSRVFNRDFSARPSFQLKNLRGESSPKSSGHWHHHWRHLQESGTSHEKNPEKWGCSNLLADPP